MISLLVRERVTKKYYVYVFIWFLVIYSNYFFHGCILSRVERYLFDNENWCGPVSLLNYIIELFGVKVDKNIANGVIKYLIAAPVCIVIIAKSLFSYDITMAFLLSILWTPLLFIHSQKPIFETIKKPQKDLLDKTIAITGCSSGLGKDIIDPLLDRGATVILLNRKTEHSKKLLQELKGKRIVNIECDLTKLKSVDVASKKIRKKFPSGIDVLYVNAGISNNPISITEDGYEIHIQTNYLSHVLLINNILDLLKKKSGRIINTSSIAYRIPESTYNPNLFVKHPDTSNIHGQQLYQQSKLGMLLYLKSIEAKIDIVNVQPGICSTNLLQNSNLPYPIKLAVNISSSSTKKGSKYLLDALTSHITDTLIGPSIFFMNANAINNELINIADSERIYKDTHTYLGLDL